MKDMNLYMIIWQEYQAEPDWLFIVAKNLTEERAKRYVKKQLLEDWDNAEPRFEYFWYDSVSRAQGIGTKAIYKITLEKQ